MPKAPKITKDKVRAYRSDFNLHARQFLEIRDHNQAKIVKLKLNNGQRILHTVAEKMKAEFGFVRCLFLKSRRFGGSTYVSGRFYSKTSLNKNRNAFIVAHEKESTNTLFSMVKLMHERNPLAPQTLKSNEKKLEFDNEKGTGLKSEFRLATAKNTSAGRSQGIHYLLCSEEAFFSDGYTLLDGLLQCLPQPPAPHEVFRESTGNGFGNSFQEQVFDVYAEGQYPYYQEDGIVYAWKNPKKDWILIFIPWFVHEEYTKSFNSEVEKSEFISKMKEKVFVEDLGEWKDGESIRLKKKFNLTWEQIHWREWMIDNQMERPTRKECERKFRQEYPSTVEDAFLATGQNVYGKEHCDEIEAMCKDPILIGNIISRAGQSKVKPNQYGKFRLWEKPDKNESYFITVDSGGGLKPSHQQDKTEPDPTCIDVWNHKSGVQCAQWHGHIEYGMIAGIVSLVGMLYFKAPACVELMNHGYTVVKDLAELNYPMYEAKPDEPGWMTNKATKPRMVDDLGEMSRTGGLQIRCSETVSEMRTFIELSGRYNAAKGCHDDRVDSAGMASQMMTMLPRRMKEMKQKSEFSGFTNIYDRSQNTDDSGYSEAYV